MSLNSCWAPKMALLPAKILGLCLLFSLAGVDADGAVVNGFAEVGGGRVVGVTDEDFVCATLDWWPPEKCDYGTCSWGLASLLNLNLNSPALLNAVKAFSPLKLRLGGSLQDKVVYETQGPCTPFVENASETFGFSQGCLPMSRWDELNSFFLRSGAVVVFGLNALNGRTRLPDGSMGGPWDYSNAASLIRYTVDKGYAVQGWELGNELCGRGVLYRISSSQYAQDVTALKNLVSSIYGEQPVKPLVIAPGGFFEPAWFKDLVDRTEPGSLDVVTHHIYNLGPGVDSNLVQKILNPAYLDGEAAVFRGLQQTLQNTAAAWVGEAGGAYNSGHNLVTNAFVFSFWYLDQLGMAASYDTKTYCRQSLIGGNYGLLNTATFRPNPDYYSALLWHRLMGRTALATIFTGTKSVRAYAHCAKQSEGIVLLLINLDVSTTVRVVPKPDPIVLRPGAELVREEYHLTAKDGDLHSQTMLLNGYILDVDQDGTIPPLRPVTGDPLQPVIVAPLSIVFAHMPYVDAPACG